MNFGELNINEYDTVLFDCDGVILNSNKVKSDSFYKTAFYYGKYVAEEFLEYHVNNGGISRYSKFEYLLKNILPKYSIENDLKNFNNNFKKLIEIYKENCFEGLKNCEVAENIHNIKEKFKEKNWLVVSGGDQDELNKILKSRNLNKLFGGGIFGSPDNKFEIISREKEKGNIKGKSILIGDSKYDYEVSMRSNIDFVFLYDWTELPNWRGYVYSNGIISRKNLNQLFFE